jgi:paraquat-inducible protein B
MMRRANATRIGLFVLVGLGLLVAAVVTVSGGRLFASNERAVMYFNGSVYGLQLGAPVVFRGVRLGSVVSIGVVHDGASGRFEIPVVAELDRSLIEEMQPAGAAATPLTVASLVAQGLTAQLSTQSLLTGLLYVDLDLRPGPTARAAASAGIAASVPAAGANVVKDVKGDMVEIPTIGTPMQALKDQLDNLKLGQLVADVSSIAASTRQFVGGAKLQQALDDMAQIAADLKRLTARLDQRIDPLATSVQATLADTRRTAGQLGAAAERVSAAADRVGTTADRVAGTAGQVDAFLASGAPMMQSLQRAADELARSATSLRNATAEDSALLINVDRASQDVSRASRAVRELADLLERQPDALLRGRPAAP